MQARCGDTLLLSLSQLDREHWELIAEENEFAGALEKGASRAELEMRLSRLIQAFQSHFQSEEGLMRLNGFPGLARHAAEHRKLIRQIQELRDDLDSGVVKLCETLAGFVRLWTERHITGPDARFAQFLQKNGSKCELRVPSNLPEPDCNRSSL
jgi:hemerythrin